MFASDEAVDTPRLIVCDVAITMGFKVRDHPDGGGTIVLILDPKNTQTCQQRTWFKKHKAVLMTIVASFNPSVNQINIFGTDNIAQAKQLADQISRRLFDRRIRISVNLATTENIFEDCSICCSD